MPDFTTDTGTIFYELLDPQEAPADGAPTLILLHNFMSTGRAAWHPLLPVLNRRLRILLPDLPGHGRSIGYPPGYHYWAIARQLAALFRSLGVAGAHLAGCSAGGMIAQLLVHHRMADPQTLTLVSTTYTTNPGHTDAELVPEDFRAGPRWMEATARLHDPYQGEGYYESTLLPAFRALALDDAIDLPLEALSRFTMPACIIHGARDEFFPAHIAESMASALPNSELHLVPRQSHALIFSQPWKVAEFMDAFLSRHT